MALRRPRPRVALPAALAGVVAVTALACSPGRPSAIAPLGSAPRYVALGDSFTAGTGTVPERSFPSRLVARWRCAPEVTLENLGVNGFTTDDVADTELPALERAPLPPPALVTLAIGANDIVHGVARAQYQAHVRQILERLRRAGATRVVTIPQPDWSRSPVAAAFGSPDALHARIVDANAILRAETEAAGGVYADLSPLMEQEAAARMIAPDGLHPSAEAYDAWAAALAEAIAPPCSR